MSTCYYCHKQTELGQYVCDACAAAVRKSEMKLERQARMIECPACHQPKGKPCLTGSGASRDWSHAKRQKIAKRYAHNTKGNRK